MENRSRLIAGAAAGVMLVGVGGLRAEGPSDLATAFSNAFSGAEACVALRGVGPDAKASVSDPATCARQLPPCDTFEIPASVIALDRGVVADTDAGVKRTPALEGDPAQGVNLRDAFRTAVPWVYEEVARRIGSDAFAKALAAMRYGNAQTQGPVEKIGKGEDAAGLALSPVDQVEFLARLKRGELPTSAESQARTVEIVPAEKLGDATLAVKTGACDGVAWAIGWVERGQQGATFAVAETGKGLSVDDTLERTRRLLSEMELAPSH